MAEYDLLISGGTVATADWTAPADVIVDGGRVAALVRPRSFGGMCERTIDAAGRLVLPGGVDGHVHIGVEFGGFATADDPQIASAAAFRGGITTVIDFAFPKTGQSPYEALEQRLDYLAPLAPDHAMHACVVAWTADTPAMLRAAMRDGVTTVKMFTTYRDTIMAEAETIGRVMLALREEGGAAYIHAESDHMIGLCQQALLEAGRIEARNHPASRPPVTEDDAVRTIVSLTEQVDATTYFVHLSTPDALRRVARARERGARVFAESCPHYLALDETVYAGDGGENFVACPPMRPPAMVAELQHLAVRGFVDSIGSDHNAFTQQQKKSSSHDLRAMPFGMPGLETSLPVVFNELVHGKNCHIRDFVRMTSTGPARLNGLYPRKGTLAPGSDADIAIWDPNADWVVRETDLHMGTDLSPFEGLAIRGRPVMVLRRGEVVLEGGHVVPGTTSGELLQAGPIEA